MVKRIPLKLLDCLPTSGSEPLARDSAEAMAKALKAVADPTRLQILAMIAASENQAACVCNLTEPLNLTQPTISHHLKTLAEVGLIEGERRGTWVWYSLNKERWSQIANLFTS